MSSTITSNIPIRPLALGTLPLGSLLLTGYMPRAAMLTPASAACLAPPEVQTTPQGVGFVRTPDACFEGLPGWNYAPKYVEIDGLRQAYIDEGPRDADPILLLHGQPSWSYLYRDMIPMLVKAGHRVIAMDHIGMGRSDKLNEVKYHSFDNHVKRLDAFVTGLKLDNLTLFAQDWDSTIGLFLAGEKPELFGRIILGNGGIPDMKEPYALPKDVAAAAAQFGRTLRSIPPQQPKFFDEAGNSRLPADSGADGNDAFSPWMAYALNAEEFKASQMLEALTYRPLTPAVLAAYDAPFPSRITMAGPRIFPSLINQLVGRTDAATEKLKGYTGLFLTIFGANEPGLSPTVQQWFVDNVPGARGQAHHCYPDASHFVQDDKGQDVAERVNRVMAANAF